MGVVGVSITHTPRVPLHPHKRRLGRGVSEDKRFIMREHAAPVLVFAQLGACVRYLHDVQHLGLQS